MYLDKQHPLPVYLQLKEALQNQIEQGIYLSHQQLPSERDLCQHHNLSRMTVRRAIKALIADGLAYTRAGKGTFVSHNPMAAGKMLVDNFGQKNSRGSERSSYNAQQQQKLMTPLLSYDSAGVERAISDALATHSLEIVAGYLFLETIKELEQQWLKGKVNLLVHKFAITTLHSQLIAMMNAATMSESGPRVLLACAPGDRHELGLTLLALNLRRRGYFVIYLGSNLTTDEFQQVINTAKPQLICLSAAIENSAENLIELGHQFQDRLRINVNSMQSNLRQKPLLTFGGVAFDKNPEFIPITPGFYLGNTIEKAVGNIQRILKP